MNEITIIKYAIPWIVAIIVSNILTFISAYKAGYVQGKGE